MDLSPASLINILQVNGFVFKRSKGSHQLFNNPHSNKTVIVPIHKGRDLKKGTYFAIIRQAGIKISDVINRK